MLADQAGSAELVDKKIASEGILRFGGACLLTSNYEDGDQQPALEVGSTRLLEIPILNETRCGFPFPQPASCRPALEWSVYYWPPEPC